MHKGKLSLLNSEVLLQQIKTRLSSWSAKALSFVDRLLLIKTVITSITIFWCSTFILFQACVKRINSLCGVFLWQGDVDKHHTARVSWVVVTKPKREGGQGIKNLAIWNKACCLKLIWLLFFQSGSVWIAWFIEEVLHWSLNNLWTTPPNRRYSWQVIKLLKLSSSIYSWIKLRVQNGLSCRFWSYNWSPFGSLKSYLSSGVNSTLGIQDQATLSSLCSNNNWSLPPARSENLVNVHTFLTTIHLNDNEDYYEWEVDGKISNRYNTGIIYEKLCVEGIYVPWFATVCNKGGIPRHSFLSWLFTLDRCPTKDRIIHWGHQTTPTCLFCNQSDESRDHLSFICPYSWRLWGSLAPRCGIQPERSWARVLTQI